MASSCLSLQGKCRQSIVLNGFLLIFSGLFYSLSFVASATFFWLMVPAVLLLWYVFVRWQLRFIDCVLWGIAAFGPRVIDVSVALVRSSGVSWWCALPLVGGILVYLVGQVALGWWLCSFGAFFVRSFGKLYRTGIFFVSFLLIHLFLVYGLFWVFGCWEGDVCSNPLVPWVRGCVCLLKGDQRPAFLESVGVVRLPFKPFVQVSCTAQLGSLAHELRVLAQTKPQVNIVLLPESSLPFCVNEHAATTEALALLSQGKQLVFGGHRLAGCVEYSSVYWFADGVLRGLRDKEHLMFFIERAPCLCGCRLPAFVGELCGGCDYFVPGDKTAAIFPLAPDLIVEPVICSELYMTNRGAYQAVNPLLGLVNDAWFAGSAQPALAWAATLLKSWWHKRPILYVSYEYATFFDGAGHWYDI